jgi:hypothetical protein
MSDSGYDTDSNDEMEIPIFPNQDQRYPIREKLKKLLIRILCYIFLNN